MSLKYRSRNRNWKLDRRLGQDIINTKIYQLFSAGSGEYNCLYPNPFFCIAALVLIQVHWIWHFHLVAVGQWRIAGLGPSIIDASSFNFSIFYEYQELIAQRTLLSLLYWLLIFMPVHQPYFLLEKETATKKIKIKMQLFNKGIKFVTSKNNEQPVDLVCVVFIHITLIILLL